MATNKHQLNREPTATHKRPIAGPEFHFQNEELWRPLYPFESHYMKIGGFAYHYIDERPEDWETDGRRDERPVLLMVHGNPTWSFFFRNLILAFRNRFRVVAVDHIGCGLSEKPTASKYPYAMENRVSDLVSLVKKLNLSNVCLVAHDWGGLIGMGAATRLPDRFSRLVLMNTAAFRSQRCPFRIRMGRIPLVSPFLVQGPNLFCKAAVKWATNRPGGLPADVAAGLVAPYDCWKNRVAVSRFVRDVPLSERHRSYKTLLEIENNLPLFRSKPVLLVWGMQDWCFSPEFLKRFLQYYPEANVRKIENAGHYLLEDAPDEVINAMENFLASEDKLS